MPTLLTLFLDKPITYVLQLSKAQLKFNDNFFKKNTGHTTVQGEVKKDTSLVSLVNIP